MRTMTEIKLEVKDPRALAKMLRQMIPVNSDDINPDERPTIEALCAQIEEQVKPAIEEPDSFGSIVRARPRPNSLSMLWHPSPMNGKHYWESETGAVEVWSELTDVEVLRVGLGDKCNCPKATPMGYGIELQPSCPQHGPDVIRVIKQDAKDAYRKGFEFGMREMNTQIHTRQTELLAEAITSERKNAYEKAIQAVEELA